MGKVGRKERKKNICNFVGLIFKKKSCLQVFKSKNGLAG
jgi:hypothetical protein